MVLGIMMNIEQGMMICKVKSREQRAEFIRPKDELEPELKPLLCSPLPTSRDLRF
jgi:hypothetical protein